MRKWEPLKKHPNIYVYETKKGKRYGIRRGFVNSENKRDEFTKSGFKDWRSADLVLKDFELKLGNGELGPVSHRSMTVDMALQRMASYKEARGLWKKATKKNTMNYYNRYLKPKFGQRKLAEITRLEYEAHLSALIKDNLANTTIHTINGVMQSIMNFAERNDVIQKNMLRSMEIVGGKPAKEQKLEKKDFDHWMATAKGMYSKYIISLLEVASLGERRGELLGLRFKDLHFFTENDTDFCKISWNVSRTPDQLEGGSLKNAGSVRENYVSGKVVDYLKYAAKFSKLAYENKDISPTEDDFIFINPDTAKGYHPSQINRLFNKISKKAGVAVNPHLLRHYFATQALNNPNVADVEVMHWLGHKNIQMTASYTRDTKDASMALYQNVQRDFKVLDGTKNKKINGTA